MKSTMKHVTLVLLGFVLLCANCLAATPKKFLEGLLKPDSLALADGEALQVADQMKDLSQRELADMLPLLFAALRQDGEPVCISAALVLFATAQRPDSGAFLRPSIREIAALLYRADNRLKATALAVFLQMKPPQTAEVVPLIEQFLLADDQSNDAKPDAVLDLVRLVPNSPGTARAVQHFMRLPLSTQTRIAALNALRSSRLENDGVISAVVEALTDADEDVKLAALRTLDGIGPKAITLASEALARLAADENQAPAVRKSARTLASRSPAQHQ